MTKLSNAGKLYLDEFYILTEAKKELDRYLDMVVDQVYQELKSKETLYSNSHFQWSVWQNKSTKGRIDVEFKVKEKISYFREGKADLYIIYKDIRHTNSLQNPASVRISLWTPAAANGVKEEVQQMSLKLHQENLYNPMFLELDLEDSQETATRMAECILDRSKMIFTVLEEIRK
ncbi:MAG: hypothetical protein LRY71_18305 [Bacillaceae bacterium]|nr:hypothetical protein [Bacillaceae bacterium]